MTPVAVRLPDEIARRLKRDRACERNGVLS